MSDEKVSDSTTPDTTECGVDAFVDLIGEPLHDHPFDTADGKIRVIHPNSAITMDHRPDRLNVDVNINGDIARLWCG